MVDQGIAVKTGRAGSRGRAVRRTIEKLRDPDEECYGGGRRDTADYIKE